MSVDVSVRSKKRISVYCYADSFTLHVDKNGHFWTTYPPHLVHVVIERPLTAAVT